MRDRRFSDPDYLANMSWWELNGAIIKVFIVTFGIIGMIFAGGWILHEILVESSEAREIRYAQELSEETAIKKVIADGKLTCEYIGDLRMHYAGDPKLNALDDNFIEKKLMTYWNVNSCGIEWTWWND